MHKDYVIQNMLPHKLAFIKLKSSNNVFLDWFDTCAYYRINTEFKKLILILRVKS